MTRVWENAIANGDGDAARDLLRRGIDADARDRHGQTALMLAAHAGHREVVAALVEHGAALDVTAKFGLSALMLAVVAGHAEVVRLLARAGAEFGLIAANTPHIVFDRIQLRSPLPLISIVEASKDAAAAGAHPVVPA